MTSEPVNYIMHIPKTAGMSLQALVRRRYKKPGQLELVYDQEKVDSGFEDQDELKLVMGHFRYGYHKISKRPAKYFTFLRDPIEQVVSHYNYTFDHPEKFKDLPKGITNILDFARCPYGYNLQTRFVSGIDDLQKNGDKALDKALLHLEKFEIVGLSEEFDLSLLMLGKKLKWNILFYEKKNYGQTRKIGKYPSTSELKELREILKFDLSLYESGKKLFNSQKKSEPELEKQLIGFKVRNRLFQTLNPYYIKLKIALGKA